ncbi:DUF441 domain-containing protein [Halothermothrix orenii]|uniref:UPF0756 membrane protein Hore_21770 n=1 Tax=Halothermothrix orenii (strain H 168 / OCM 544 / DSM 9562) TaxID=373903 RepID=Y2177_HALOH|nr:DUF441 domain-containing protein [Halothermothrix orenii]B8D0I7.1 RecName: Full=UPF0756 membrane protein Hore_21770 [Halothermothrix orenii H 168]ACL70923.1 predicted membrane protein [Halothermothrix orenii H 168]
MNIKYFLLIITILGFLARSRVLVIAGLLLLTIYEFEIDFVFEFLGNKGIEIGLIFLLMAILSSLVLSPVDGEVIKDNLLSWQGTVAIIAGVLATKFNGMGLDLLQESPQFILGIIMGSLVGIVFFGGIPVGPLMAAGIGAVLFKIIEIIKG